MKKFILFLLCILLIISAGCLSGESKQNPSTAGSQAPAATAATIPTPNPVIQAGSSGDRLYSVSSDKTDDKIDLYECADMALTEWYNVEDTQKSATFMVGNLRKMPQNLTEIEDVWILTTDNEGKPVAIVPRDHVEILQYESSRVFYNGAPIPRPIVFHNFMNLMIEFKDKVRKYNEWMADNLVLLSPSGSENLDESMKAKWTEKYQKEKEIDEIVDLLHHQLGDASFAVYPPFGNKQASAAAQTTAAITSYPTASQITAVTTTPVLSSTSKPFISASIKSSTVKRGDNLQIGGVAEGGARFVYINIFSLDGTTFPTKVYTANVESDGWYELTLDTNAFPAGLYGVTLELPTGEYTKLSFLIE